MDQDAILLFYFLNKNIHSEHDDSSVLSMKQDPYIDEPNRNLDLLSNNSDTELKSFNRDIKQETYTDSEIELVYTKIVDTEQTLIKKNDCDQRLTVTTEYEGAFIKKKNEFGSDIDFFETEKCVQTMEQFDHDLMDLNDDYSNDDYLDDDYPKDNDDYILNDRYIQPNDLLLKFICDDRLQLSTQNLAPDSSSVCFIRNYKRVSIIIENNETLSDEYYYCIDIQNVILHTEKIPFNYYSEQQAYDTVIRILYSL
jgi:hypothetical protein